MFIGFRGVGVGEHRFARPAARFELRIDLRSFNIGDQPGAIVWQHCSNVIGWIE